MRLAILQMNGIIWTETPADNQGEVQGWLMLVVRMSEPSRFEPIRVEYIWLVDTWLKSLAELIWSMVGPQFTERCTTTSLIKLIKNIRFTSEQSITPRQLLCQHSFWISSRVSKVGRKRDNFTSKFSTITLLWFACLLFFICDLKFPLVHFFTYFFPFFHPFILLSFHLSIFLSFHPSILPSLYPSILPSFLYIYYPSIPPLIGQISFSPSLVTCLNKQHTTDRRTLSIHPIIHLFPFCNKTIQGQ